MAAIHHYLSQFLLRNFCSGPKPKIWAYDKATGKSFETNVHNVGGERNFNEIEIGDRILSLEEGLGELEAKVAPILQGIIAARSIGNLSEDDRINLAVFIATQMQRGPHSREHIMAVDAGLQKALRDRGIDPADVQDYTEMTVDDAKALSLMMLSKPNEIPFQILNKSWLLFETDAAHPFYISDNPVVRQNLLPRKNPLMGNLGLVDVGIEIYLPISCTMMLAFYCRSHEQVICQGVEKWRISTVRNPALNTPNFSELLKWMRAFRTGVALDYAPENVLNHNALQVWHAERYIFSSLPNFALVEDMLRNEPRYRVGPRPHIN